MSEIPEYMQKMMATSSLKRTEDMAEHTTVPRITTKGKIFKLKKGDIEQKVPDNILDVVIINISPTSGYAKTYFAGNYAPGSSDAPDCSSSDGIRPDDWVNNKQSSNCASCPQNQWGSKKSMSGGKAKSCRDSKRIYVALAKDFSASSEPYLLSVSVNSLKNYANFINSLPDDGVPNPCFIITRITMDDDAEVPLLKFQNLGFLNEDHASVSVKMAEKAERQFNKPRLESKATDRKKLDSPQDPAVNNEASGQSIDNLADDWE